MGIGTNLFVGCGGSGIRTLMRLNELLSEDLYWRRQVDEQIYYLLIDTDVDVFDTFDSIVGRQLRGASPPRTVRVRLAQGVDNLQPLANKHFIRPFAVEGDRDAEQRLYDHWWAERRLRPYTAPDVKPLSKGAGQCPPAAYFLTWWNMREIDRAFDSIMREVIVRRGVESLERMNFCVVSSLAGGTGRGCWKLVAFKVRQLFLRHNKVPAPVAFLFDSSVFRDVMESYPEQRLAMTINSLTGFSELSCWVKNVYGRGRSGCPPIMYNLPDMEDPGKPAMDVLTVSIDLDQTAAAPVDNAVLVFEQSPVAVLADHAQYYEMVGNALYAALTQSVIESEKINQAEPYLGVSAATFEVSAATLNDYFEGLARICAIEALLHRTEGAPETEAERFFKETGLALEITEQSRSAYKAKEKGTFIQRACQELLEAYKNEMATLKDALDRDDVMDAGSAAVALSSENRAAVAQAVARTVATMSPEPLTLAEQCVAALYRDTRSVENARAFLEQLILRIKNSLESLPAPSSFKLAPEQDLRLLIAEKSRREILSLPPWRHFNDKECSEIMSRAPMAILYANYGPMVEEVTKAYRGWAATLSRWQKNAEILRDRALKLLTKMKGSHAEALMMVSGGDEEVFDHLFTDSESPERAILAKFAPSRFVRRVVKPVLKRGQERSLLAQPEVGREVNDLILHTLTKTSLTADDYDAIDELGRTLESRIMDAVHLEPGFVRKHFAFAKVVKDLRQAWLARFSREGSDVKRNEIIEQFEQFFGLRPTFDGDRWSLPGLADMLLGMAASLAATCRPFWRLRESSRVVHRVAVFLPPADVQVDKASAKAKISEMIRVGGDEAIRVDVYTDADVPDRSKEGRANPFVLLTYSTDGASELKDLASLDYWKNDALLCKWLLRCESAEGESIFNREDNNRGVGFVDPIYVRNETLRALRWRPWADVLPPPAEDENKLLDAMVYAMMNPPESLGRRLEGDGWNLPLIRDRGRERYEFARQACLWEKEKALPDPNSPWDEGQQICQSICQVFDVLMGKGTKQGRLKAEGLEWRDRLLAEEKLFWETVAVKHGCVKGSEAYRELLGAAQVQLGEIRKRATPDDERIWKMMIKRIDERLGR